MRRLDGTERWARRRNEDERRIDEDEDECDCMTMTTDE